MDPTEGNLALFITWLLMGIFTLVLNISCIVVLHKSPELDEATRVFLTSLNAADLGVCIFFILPSVGTAFVGDWPFGNVLCTTQVLTMQPCIFAVVLSVVGVNIERYIAICYPLRYPKWITAKRAKVAAASLWIIGVFIILMCGIEAEWLIRYLDNHQMCFFDLHDCQKTWMAWYAFSICALSVGILIVLILYIIILRVVRKRTVDTVEIQFAGQVKPIRKKQCKAATTFSLLTLSLAIGYMPYLLACYFEAVNNPWSYELLLFARLSFASNGWWHVILYYGRNKALRRSGKRVLSNFLQKSRAISAVDAKNYDQTESTSAH